MKFAHLVRHNGITYPAGTDVPVGVPDGGSTTNVSKSVEIVEPTEPVQRKKPGRPKKA